MQVVVHRGSDMLLDNKVKLMYSHNTQYTSFLRCEPRASSQTPIFVVTCFEI